MSNLAYDSAPEGNETPQQDIVAMSALRPVPRISIQAFCETESIAGPIERAGEDRRMAKAHLKVHMGGVATALGCDIRICSDNSRFAVPAAKLGLGYDYDGIRRLVDVVGPSFAKEIFYTARQFSAREAKDMGLVDRVVPEAALDSYVRDYAMTIAANAPMTMHAAKTSILESLKDPADRDLALCERFVDACNTSQDYDEGRTAFMEKRKPKFVGR